MAATGGDEVDLEFLKRELLAYLDKREELSADEEAKKAIGKKVGGTKGNPILEYVSGAPNKEIVIEEAPNAFDYDELTKYGYGRLATPIMKAGGRFAMYELLGIEAPAITSKPKPKSAPKLVIDRTGEDDPARYSGLKLGQVLDDSVMAEALQEAQRKVAEGEELRSKLIEEEYVRPFADRRNVGPKQTPDWTPERLDEWGKRQGEAATWARKAKEGMFVRDPYETLDLEASQRFYSILTALLASLAFGRSTATLLSKLDLDFPVDNLLVPASALLLASIGSSVFCVVQAGKLNRNQFVWFTKGLLGGPMTISQLRGLSGLLTQAEVTALKSNK